MKKLPFIFNFVLCIIFFCIAGYYVEQTEEALPRAIMWITAGAWSAFMIYIMHTQEREKQLDNIKKNQEKIIEELERFHNIDVVFKDK